MQATDHSFMQSTSVRTLGIDGCKAGWIIAELSSQGIRFSLSSLTVSLAPLLKSVDMTLIDVPVGLPSDHYPRSCDLRLKEALGAKRSSVFLTPLREAVYASSYREACDIQYAYTGKKISIQSWNICPPIRVIDELLTTEIALQGKVKESHPEFLFQRYKGESLTFKKKTTEGFEERLEILSMYLPSIRDTVDTFLVSTKRNEVQPDDILDASILAVDAMQGLHNGFDTFPKQVPFDDMSLEMAIYFSKFKQC